MLAFQHVKFISLSANRNGGSFQGSEQTSSNLNCHHLDSLHFMSQTIKQENYQSQMNLQASLYLDFFLLSVMKQRSTPPHGVSGASLRDKPAACQPEDQNIMLISASAAL